MPATPRIPSPSLRAEEGRPSVRDKAQATRCHFWSFSQEVEAEGSQEQNLLKLQGLRVDGTIAGASLEFL